LVNDAFKAMRDEDTKEAKDRNYDRSYQLARKAYKANGENLNAMFCLGIASEAVRKLDTAKFGYLEIVKRNVKDTSYRFAYMNLAYLYSNEGDAPNAVKTIEAGVPYFLHDTCFKVDYAITYSIVMMRAGRSEDAEEIMTKALKKDPTNFILLTNYGSQLNEAKFYDEAIIYFKRALDINPNDATVNFNMGSCYFNQFVEKRNAANKIEDNDAFNKAKEEAKEFLLSAKPYFEKALELDPEDKSTLISLRRLYMEINETEKYKAIENKLKEIEEKASKE
jgi:tetratricopeptide (TPR) repeat protein